MVRQEIKIARVDLANKQLTEKLASNGIWFPMGTTIYIGKDARLMKYDGNARDFNMLAHQMQRVATPVINLSSEEQILDFLDNTKNEIWHEDYNGLLLPKGKTFDEDKAMDALVD